MKLGDVMGVVKEYKESTNKAIDGLHTKMDITNNTLTDLVLEVRVSNTNNVNDHKQYHNRISNLEADKIIEVKAMKENFWRTKIGYATITAITTSVVVGIIQAIQYIKVM